MSTSTNNSLPATERSKGAAKFSTYAAVAALAGAALWGASQLLAAGDDPRPAEAVKPAVVTVVTRDYAFDAPDTIQAGVVTLRLQNKGADLHHIWLIRLDSGKTVDDFAAAMHGHEGPLPKWAVDAGGPNAPVPGGQYEATLSLTPGNYVMVCVIPAADGVPHFMKGMVRPLTVVAPRSAAVMPKADVEIKLVDYNFAFSQPLTAGQHTIRFVNNAAQPHEAFIAKLAPGVTAPQVMAWIQKMEGPPPFMPAGGIVGIAPGGEVVVTTQLEAGEYGLFCFVPDAKDGKPHVAHGMFKQITVK